MMKTANCTVEFKDKKANFLVISDTHFASTKDIHIMQAILKEIERIDIQYDAICFLGDLVDNTSVLKDVSLSNNILKFLNTLADKAPLFIVKGNHDICALRKIGHVKRWVIDEDSFEKKILNLLNVKEKNIYVNNGSYSLSNEISINIYNPSPKYIKNSKEKREQILNEDRDNYKFLSSLDPEKLNILLCHYPDVLKWLHKEGFLKNVDLAIAGHNHSGMTQNIFIETIFKILGQKNRGIVTPNKSFKFKDTKEMRGLLNLTGRTKIYINPAVSSLAPNTKLLKIFNFLFYRGISIISVGEKKDKI